MKRKALVLVFVVVLFRVVYYFSSIESYRIVVSRVFVVVVSLLKKKRKKKVEKKTKKTIRTNSTVTWLSRHAFKKRIQIGFSRNQEPAKTSDDEYRDWSSYASKSFCSRRSR